MREGDAGPGNGAAPANITVQGATGSEAKSAGGGDAKRLVIPGAFVGGYDESSDACSQPSQYRLRISPTQLRFHESVGNVVAVESISSTSIEVTADYEGEGEKWQSVRQLDLSDDHMHLVVSGDGTSFTRIRCP